MKLPDLLVIGEQKSGTTTVAATLSASPDIIMSAEKELHYFASYQRFGPCGRYPDTPLESYAAHFADAGSRLAGEATPNYLSDPGAPARIREAVPNAKLIVVLRDPVTRAWSHYWHQVRGGIERRSFERAVDIEPERIASGDADDFERFTYTTRGRYIDGIERFALLFGRESILVMFMSDVVSRPGSAVEQLSGFLGVNGWAIETSPHKNRADYPRWPAADRLKRRVMDSCARVAPGATTALKRIGRATRSMRVYHGEPRMKPSTRRRLEGMFAEPNRRLADWLGQPLPWFNGEGSNR